MEFATPNARYASRQRKTNAEIMANKQRSMNEQRARNNAMIASSSVFKLPRPPPPRRPEGWKAPNYAPPPKSATVGLTRRLRRGRRKETRRRYRR